MPSEIIPTDTNQPFALHLLDVGFKEYGDAVLCQFGDVSVLIDGAHTGDQDGSPGHKSIPSQIGQLLNQSNPPYHITLIIVSHAHEDHIGCLPALVKDNLLTADWALVADPILGWGRSSDGSGDADSLLPDAERRVVTALREEVLSKDVDEQTLADFMDAAFNLENRYLKMLETLSQRGTKVINYRGQSPGNLIVALQQKGVNLKVLGPSEIQAFVCAEIIRKSTQQVVRDVAEVRLADSSVTPTILYRSLINPISTDAADAATNSRPGNAINLQSLVTVFEYQGKKFLFAGDMQFTKAELSGSFVTAAEKQTVETEIKKLRAQVRQEAPFDFVKISHHGSFNAFSEDLLQEWGGTRLFGICAGESSEKHPARGTLKTLNKYRNEIQWARTDHNRLATLDFSGAQPKWILERGEINDPVPNSTDEVIRAEEFLTLEEKKEVAAPMIQPLAPQPVLTERIPSVVEVTAKVPHTKTRVTITIDVEPGHTFSQTPPSNQTIVASTPTEKKTFPVDKPPLNPTLPPLQIAGGRQLPLLFVTNRAGLANKIGDFQCEHLLNSIRQQNYALIDQLPVNPSDSASTIKFVQTELKKLLNIKGLVILGGYDVVPAQRLDCLPFALRQTVINNDDPDNFIVWSDDIYGDNDDDLIAEIPVSRIPDGGNAELVFAAIQAKPLQTDNFFAGVRNFHRPFADKIRSGVWQERPLLISEPTTVSDITPSHLQADCIYFMLHGDYTDARRFWGERELTRLPVETVNLGNLPETKDSIVFAGCCWGALTVNTPAGRLVEGRGMAANRPEDSIALAILKNGARAFVGCTGVHYSPNKEPYNFFGGPMHSAFWENIKSGDAPAEALFKAKIKYAAEIPHGRNKPEEIAVAHKILWQFTCLGLGW